MNAATPSETAAPSTDGAETGRGVGLRALALLARYGTLAVLVLMLVAFSVLSPKAFMTQGNLVNILNQSALLAIVAGGLTFVLVAGQFDLSFGNVVSLTGILTVGFIVRNGMAFPIAILLALGVTVVVGLVNGALVAYLRVNAIVATLGTSTILLGLNFWYSNGTPISVPEDSSFDFLARGQLFGVPMPVIIMILVLFVLWLLLNRTLLGYHTRAVGSNATAARLAGVSVARVTLSAFIIGAVCAGVAGVLLASRLGSAQVTAGDSYLLGAFAACFLGASVLRDGEFHIIGTAVGVLIVTVATNGFALLGAPSFVQYLVQGVILITAVALSTTSRRLLGQTRS